MPGKEGQIGHVLGGEIGTVVVSAIILIVMASSSSLQLATHLLQVCLLVEQ